MTFDKVKGVAELVGLGAIIISLIFVGLELRQTQEALTATALQSRAELQVAETTALYESEFLPEIIIKIAGGESLNSIELLRFRTWTRGYHRIHELSYMQHESGILSESAISEVQRSILRTFSNTSNIRNEMIEAWEIYGEDYDPRYQAIVNSILAD